MRSESVHGTRRAEASDIYRRLQRGIEDGARDWPADFASHRPRGARVRTRRRPTAAVFVVIVFLLDVFLVALLVERSFAMFRSVLGTWLAFALIFLSAWLTGVVAARDLPNFSDDMTASGQNEPSRLVAGSAGAPQ
jgi:hypothetical protein